MQKLKVTIHWKETPSKPAEDQVLENVNAMKTHPAGTYVEFHIGLKETYPGSNELQPVRIVSVPVAQTTGWTIEPAAIIEVRSTAAGLKLQ